MDPDRRAHIAANKQNMLNHTNIRLRLASCIFFGEEFASIFYHELCTSILVIRSSIISMQYIKKVPEMTSMDSGQNDTQVNLSLPVYICTSVLLLRIQNGRFRSETEVSYHPKDSSK